MDKDAQRKWNAAIAQICSSDCVFPKAGMPVILTPFLTIQNTSAGSFCRAALSRSGGEGNKPWETSVGGTPGAPWQMTQLSRKNRAPERTLSGVSRSDGA